MAEVGKPIINGNPTVGPSFLDDRTREPVLNLALALPFPSGGEGAGVLAVFRASRNSFSSDDLIRLLPVSQLQGRFFDGPNPSKRREWFGHTQPRHPGDGCLESQSPVVRRSLSLKRRLRAFMFDFPEHSIQSVVRKARPLR